MPSWPLAPWHAAQFSSKITLPCATVPLPSGKPLPSGRTSISHAFISSGDAGRPKSTALAGDETMPATTAAKTVLGKDIANPPRRIDAPGLLRIVVKQRIRPHLRDKRRAVWLNIAHFVG